VTDQIRTLDELLTLLADNNTGDISEQDMRDQTLSLWYRGGYDNLDDLLDSPSGPQGEGTIWRAGDTLYEEASPTATDMHYVTDGGVKLYDLTPLVERQGSMRLRRAMKLNTGFTGDGHGGELFPGSSGAPQGFAIANWNGVKTAFLLQHTVHDSYKVTERQTVVAAPYRDDGQDPPNSEKVWSDQLAVGHQSLSAVENGDGSVTLYSNQTTEASHEDDDTGKGFTKIEWRGSDTDQTDVISYQLFGYQGSGHRFEAYHTSTVGVDPSNTYVVLVARKDSEMRRRLFIYDLAEVLAAGDPLLVDPLVSEVIVDTPTNAYGDALQAVAAGPDNIALLFGFTPARDVKFVAFFDYGGRQTPTLEIDGARVLYTEDELLSDPTLGVPYANEPEGMTWDGGNKLLCLFYDVWRDVGDVRTYEGIDFACVDSSSTGSPPGRGNNDWVKTDFPSDGTYDPAATYVRGAAYTQKDNAVMTVEPPRAAMDDLPLLAGNANPQSGAALHTGDDPIDVTVPANRSFTLQDYNEEIDEYRLRMVHNGNRFSVYGSGDDEDHDRFASLKMNTEGTADRAEFRINGNSGNGGALTLTGPNDAALPESYFLTGNRQSDSSLQTLLSYDGDTDRNILRPNAGDISAITARDAISGGNVSPTTPSGTISELGGVVNVNLQFDSFDITGMTGANNMYVGVLPYTPANEHVLGPASLNNFDFNADEVQAMWVVNTSGMVFLRMLRDNASYQIADVSQFDGASFSVCGTFEANTFSPSIPVIPTAHYGLVFEDRAACEAASIPAYVVAWGVSVPWGANGGQRVIGYHRADPSAVDPAIVSGNGVKGFPDGQTYAEHWKDNEDPGTTPMETAIQSAFAYADDVHFPDSKYRIEQTVVISDSRKSWNCEFGTIFQCAQPAGDPGVWLRDVDPTVPGSSGPVNTKFFNCIFQKIGTDTAPLLRATVATNTFLQDCEFWGGSPDILLEGCRNFESIGTRTSPTIAYASPQEAQIKQTWWQYSDLSFRRGFSVVFEGGSLSSKTDPGTSLYERTVLVESSDGFTMRGTYWGASDVSFEVKPTESTMVPGSIMLRDLWFDDGGGSFVGATKIKLDTSDANASRIPMIDAANLRCTTTSDQIAIHINEVNEAISGVRSSGSLFSGAYEEMFLVDGDAAHADASIYLTGGEITGWGNSQAPAPAAAGAFDVTRAGSINLDGVRVNGGSSTLGSDIFTARSGGVDFIGMDGCSIENYSEAGGQGIISQPTNVNRIHIDAGNDWADGDITQQLRHNNWSNFGVGADLSELLTDFELEIPGGLYRSVEAPDPEETQNGPPLSGGFNATVEVLRGVSQSTTIIYRRNTTDPVNQKVFFGFRSGATGALTWYSDNDQEPINVADLPPAGQNRNRSMLVDDATSTTFFDAVVGGGANTVFVRSIGSGWRIG